MRSLPILLGLSLLASGCGAAAVVRPTAVDDAAPRGTETPSCAGTPALARPFVVDLETEARADLETAMKKGLVIVRYDCQTLRVLTGCGLAETGYAYAGVSPTERVVHMTSQEDVSANLPLSARKLGAALQSGGSLELGLVLVGRRSSTVARLERRMLEGRCEGATHFLHAASVGAFSLVTGAAGKAGAIDPLFDARATAKSNGTRSMTMRDGSLEACRASTPDSAAPPADCRAPIGLELRPIDGDELAETRPSSERNLHEGTSGGGRATSYRKACELGHADSCGWFAVHSSAGSVEAARRQEALAVASKGCEMGSALSCDMAALAFSGGRGGKREPRAALRAWERGCALGDGGSCASASAVHIQGDEGIEKDPARGIDLLGKSCAAGNNDHCVDLAELLFEAKNGVKRDLERAYGVSRKACLADPGACRMTMDIALALEKHDLAFIHAVRACDDAHGDMNACLRLAELYAAGRGTDKDVKKAERLWMSYCSESRDWEEQSCKRLGVKRPVVTSAKTSAPSGPRPAVKRDEDLPLRRQR